MPARTDARFSRILNRLTGLPTLPEVAEELLQLSENNAAAREFARIIETDAGITAKVLKLVPYAQHWTRRAGIAFSESKVVPPDEPAPLADWMDLDEETLSEKIGDVEERISGPKSLFKSA